MIKAEKINLCSTHRIIAEKNDNIVLNYSKAKLNSSPFIGYHIPSNRDDHVMLTFRYNKYFYDETCETLVPLYFNLTGLKNKDIHAKYSRGITTLFEYNYQLNKFGRNVLCMPRSFFSIFFEQALHPFYIYEMLCVIYLFYYLDYYFAAIILVLSFISLGLNSWRKNKNYNTISYLKPSGPKALREFEYASPPVNQKKRGEITEYTTDDTEKEKDNLQNDLGYIVPGDLLYLTSNQNVPCDCILFDGICTANESDLNGESCAVVKYSLPNDMSTFTFENFRANILFQGTRIEKCESKFREGVTAMVISSGFNTFRGNLIQNILFAPNSNLSFYPNRKVYFAFSVTFYVLVCIGLIGLYKVFYTDNNDLNDYIPKFFDAVIISFPPMLPICMTLISFYLILHLNMRKIVCLEENRMKAAGQVNVIFFDKTGTLTEEDLDIYGFQTTMINDEHPLMFDKIVTDTKVYNYVHDKFWKVYCDNPSHPLFSNYQHDMRNNIVFYLQCLATCHSIRKAKDDFLGNSIDKRIFDCVNWIQEQSYECKRTSRDGMIVAVLREEEAEEYDTYDMIPKNAYKITEGNAFRNDNTGLKGRKFKLSVVKRFEFSSQFQTMSVVVKNSLDDSFRFFMKGAPEKILQLCSPNSFPNQFEEELLKHTKNGRRVLACATKYITQFNCDNPREFYENNLIFLGFIIFKNTLKRDTKQVIANLKKMNCELMMSTGDNPFTSISVALECEMIDDKKIFILDFEQDHLTKESQLKITPFIQIKNVYQTAILNQQKNQKKKKPKKTHKQSQMESLLDYFGSYSERRELAHLQVFKRKDGRASNKDAPRKKSSPNTDFQIFKFFSQLSPDNMICISGTAFDHILRLYKQELLENRKDPSSKFKDSEVEDIYYKYIIDWIKTYCKIYFRMTPTNKADLVKLFKEDKMKIVAMCGNGANDCGALLAADVGVSVGKNKNQSITCHFYSHEDSINCIETIIKSGRACFENSLVMLKYSLLYSAIQLTSFLLLFSTKSTFEDNQWGFINFIVIFVSMILATKIGVAYNICAEDEKYSMFQASFLATVTGQVILQVGWQICFFLYLKVYRLVDNPKILNSERDDFSVDSNTEINRLITLAAIVVNLLVSFNYNWIINRLIAKCLKEKTTKTDKAKDNKSKEFSMEKEFGSDKHLTFQNDSY